MTLKKEEHVPVQFLLVSFGFLQIYERLPLEYGKLSLEINNMVSTVDPQIIKQLLNRKEYFQQRSLIYKVTIRANCLFKSN